MTNNIKDYIILGKEVEEAIANNKPLVALETTIITHGMPYPENIETALAVEKIIRDNGAIPATIAIIDGVIRVGLTKDEIIGLAKKQGVVKASRRDLPVILAKKMSGATTVAGTMLIAKLAGIKIFVTGGIGGVHRGAKETMDISADLIELANTDVAVVCAGAKSILDIGLTLEYLETQGVPVLGLRTENFPAFYTRDSGFKADYQISNEKEIAKVIDIKWRMGLKGGVVVANPIPEDYALPNDFINHSINAALAELNSLQISGKEVTPFLLDKLDKLTASKSLQSNIELVKHNAYVGAIIAVEYNSILHD